MLTIEYQRWYPLQPFWIMDGLQDAYSHIVQFSVEVKRKRSRWVIDTNGKVWWSLLTFVSSTVQLHLCGAVLSDIRHFPAPPRATSNQFSTKKAFPVCTNSKVKADQSYGGHGMAKKNLLAGARIELASARSLLKRHNVICYHYTIPWIQSVLTDDEKIWCWATHHLSRHHGLNMVDFQQILYNIYRDIKNRTKYARFWRYQQFVWLYAVAALSKFGLDLERPYIYFIIARKFWGCRREWHSGEKRLHLVVVLKGSFTFRVHFSQFNFHIEIAEIRESALSYK